MSFTKKHFSITALACLLVIDGTAANLLFDSQYKSATPSVREGPHRSLMHKLPEHPEPHAAVPPIPESVTSVHAVGAEGGAGAVGAVHSATGSVRADAEAAGHTSAATEEANEAGALHHSTRPPKDEGPYAIFAQKWMPSVKFTKHWTIYLSGNEADAWVKHLMIDNFHLLHPKTSAQGPEKLPPKALDLINKLTWIEPRDDEDYYDKVWHQYGRSSGLNPEQYVHLLNRLQTEHPTPDELHVKDETHAISYSVLEEKFHNACLVCTHDQGKQYLAGVHHCLSVQEKTHHSNKVVNLIKVPYAGHCGVCKDACTKQPIHIPLISTK